MPELRPIDEDLLDALRSGQSSALAIVFDKYGSMVYRVAYRFIGNTADAQDVLQDVFVALPESLVRLESAAAFESWLKRMTVRTSLMRKRSSSRREKAESRASPLKQAVEMSPDALDHLEIERLIEQLPEALRNVFVLHDIEGFKHAEIAEMLDISERASQQRMHRARARLRLLLKR